MAGRDVSPGLRSRPSLSVLEHVYYETGAGGVAGTTVPAFVERYATCKSRYQICRVAGTTVPAFVERVRVYNLIAATARCRRDYGPGLR